MKKLSQSVFYLIILGVLTTLLLLSSFLWDTHLPMDIYTESRYYKDTIDLNFGLFHIMINIIIYLSLFISYVVVLVDWLESEYGSIKRQQLYKNYLNFIKNIELKPIKTTKNKLTMKKTILWITALFLLFTLFNITKFTVKDMSNVYNKSKLYQNYYNQKVEEKMGFYDNMWKTYLQKEKVTNVNKETFISVTKIIMENRADGKNITWKWLQENQQIPYDEFTKFYADLSNFITTQRQGYFNIEKECQIIANGNNTLLDTFPNNIYNKILKCEHIKFEYGFTSDSTQTVFKNKTENIK